MTQFIEGDICIVIGDPIYRGDICIVPQFIEGDICIVIGDPIYRGGYLYCHRIPNL